MGKVAGTQDAHEFIVRLDTGQPEGVNWGLLYQVLDWGLVGGLWGARAFFGGLLGFWVLVTFWWGRDGLLVFGLREVESFFALFRSLGVFEGSFAVGS